MSHSHAPEASPAELEASAGLHHQLFTGFILGLAGHHGLARAAEFVERSFSRQHEERFVRGLETLGLSGLPPAVACARYICLSNRAGGLDVHYHEEGPLKAWVRYPTPRWAYPGASICALDNRVTEAFLRGFHARCGPSLGSDRLRFVCTGMTTNGDPGLTGYFQELTRPVAEKGRLALHLGEAAPAFDTATDPLPAWSSARLNVTRRNYAVRYIQVMIPVLLEMLGRREGAAFATHCARLVGLQGCRDTLFTLGAGCSGSAGFLKVLAGLNRGSGNVLAGPGPYRDELRLSRFRLGDDPLVFQCWSGLWQGMLAVSNPELSLRILSSPAGWQVQ